MADAGPDLDRVLGDVRTPPAGAQRRRTACELPLFGSPIPDDEPLITQASPPRPPLAVRRATPEVPRLRERAAARADRSIWRSTRRADRRPSSTPASAPLDGCRGRRRDGAAETDGSAGGSLRGSFAVAIDLLILAAIDVVVIYFTMQICGIELDDLGILPEGPLLAFLLVQNGGYLVAFTAGGQTLGKMAAGIRVVLGPDRPRSISAARSCAS